VLIPFGNVDLRECSTLCYEKKSTALKNKYEISLKGSELFCMNTFDYVGQTEIQTSKKIAKYIFQLLRCYNVIEGY